MTLSRLVCKFGEQLDLESELASELYCDEVVDGSGRLQYIDRVGSVSALVEVEDDFAYDPLHVELNRRLIHNG